MAVMVPSRLLVACSIDCPNHSRIDSLCRLAIWGRRRIWFVSAKREDYSPKWTVFRLCYQALAVSGTRKVACRSQKHILKKVMPCSRLAVVVETRSRETVEGHWLVVHSTAVWTQPRGHGRAAPATRWVWTQSQHSATTLAETDASTRISARMMGTGLPL